VEPTGGAEPARAGRDRAVVLAVEPAAAEAIARVSVAGGDTGLVLDVAPGHEVTVLGYEGEPYLRVQRDGTTQVNTSSRSAAVNADRYGSTPSAPTSGSGTEGPEPTWATIGTDGQVFWHDHRVHWMASTIDPTPDEDGHIQDWVVKLIVDGAPATVRGDLRREADAAAWPYALLALAVAGGFLVIGRRSPPRGLVVTQAAAAVAVVAITVVSSASRPPGASPDVVLIGLAAAITVSTIVAGSQVRHHPKRTWYAGPAGTALTVGFLTQVLPEWWRPILVTAMPAVAERVLLAIAAGAALAAALLLVQAVESALVAPPPGPEGRARVSARAGDG
jgi:hypothetical protein